MPWFIRAGVVVTCLVAASRAAMAVDFAEATAVQVAEAAKKEGHKTILILVREDARSDTDSEAAVLLPNLKDALRDALAAQKLDFVFSDEVEKNLGNGKSNRRLEPADVEQASKKAKFDAVLSVDFRKQGSKRTLAVSVVDPKGIRLKGSVALADATAAKKAASQQASKPLPPPGTITGISRGSGTSSSSGSTVSRGIGSSSNSTKDRAKEKEADDNKKKLDSLQKTVDKLRQEIAEKKAADAAAKVLSPLNEKVVSFAAGQLGKQVGDGECATLAAKALEAAKARPPEGLNFGDTVGLDKIKTGDIVQFKDAVFRNDSGTTLLGQPDHTAVVYGVQGNQIYILHQNVGGDKTVSAMQLDLGDKTSGDIAAFRPVPQEAPTTTTP